MPAGPESVRADPASDPDRGGIAVIAGSAALITFAIVFPRSAAAIFMLPLVIALARVLTGFGRAGQRMTLAPLPLALLAFAAWGMVSAAWSADPVASLSKPLFLVGGTVGFVVMAASANSLPEATLRRVGLGVVLGLVIGGTLLCIETLTDQALSRFVYNVLPSLRASQQKHLSIDAGRVVAIAENNINRRATVVTMLLLPAAYIAATLRDRAARYVSLAVLAAIAAVLLCFSGHQSSQAAIVLGVTAYLLSRALGRKAVWLIGAAWVGSCLLIVPIVGLLHETGIHKDERGLFFSARHRIVIWNYTSEQIRKAPWLGVGADATGAITLAREKQGLTPPPKDGQFVPTAARHAHNAFLQVWYELGVVGAIILTAIGIAALVFASTLPAQVHTLAIAQFAAIAGMIAFSFSIWQIWFQGAIGLGASAMMVGELMRGARANSTPGDASKLQTFV